MSLNILETVQKNLHYPPLQKVDPNTQQVVADTHTSDEHRFSQAAIPAVLTGLYTYSGNDDGAENILRGDLSSNWVNEIFGTTSDDVVKKISTYSFQPDSDNTFRKINDIATESIKVIRQEIKPDAPMMEVKKYLSAQTTNWLSFLPAELQMGQLVNEESLDDNTNKMEGPISSLMHKIGSAFSNPSNETEVNAKQ